MKRHGVTKHVLTMGLLVGVLLMSGTEVATTAGNRNTDAVEQEKLAAIGLAIVKDKCARCHAIAMDDKSPHEKAPPFRDVVERYPSENLAEALAEGIVSGHPDMPVFVFEPAEIEGFIAYLDSLGPSELAPDSKDRAPAEIKQ